MIALLPCGASAPIGNNTDKPRQIGVSQVGYLPFSVVNFDLLNDTVELCGGKLANVLEDYLANKFLLEAKPLNTLRHHTYVCSLENSIVGDLLPSDASKDNRKQRNNTARNCGHDRGGDGHPCRRRNNATTEELRIVRLQKQSVRRGRIAPS